MSWTTMFKIALARTPIGSTLRRVPLVEKSYAWHMLRRTDHGALFAGVYDSYAAAQQDIPAHRHNDWDNEESSKIWVNHVDVMQPTAYAPFFWLSRLLHEGATLVDYGGSIGLSYYGYTRRRALPLNARWVVVEVPHLVKTGREVARREKAAQLEFISDLAAAPQSDILLAAGALQFIEDAVPGFLDKLAALPRHLLLNKVPITEGESYWTLHNFYTGISPYRVYNKSAFMSYFEDLGYRLHDSWKVPDMSCDVPFHPSRSITEFSGFYFEKI
jgi:putative methyltransferase (TIGR04325 family)